MSTSSAKVSTPAEFTKGAGAGKGGDTPPSDSNRIPPERGNCLGSTKQPAFGAKKYTEYGAAAPKLSASGSHRKE